MRIIITNQREAEIFKSSWHALTYQLGPEIEIEAILPNGEQLIGHRGGKSPTALCASLNERMEDLIERKGW